MSDFLSNLIQRSLTGNDAVRPRLHTTFESSPETPVSFFSGESHSQVVEAHPLGEVSERISNIESFWPRQLEGPFVLPRKPDLERPIELGRSDGPAQPAESLELPKQLPLGKPKLVSDASVTSPLTPQQPMASPRSIQVSEPILGKNDRVNASLPEGEAQEPSPAASEQATRAIVHEVRAKRVIELMRPESPPPDATKRPANIATIRPALPRTLRHLREREDSTVPSINVTIGRVEVRASLPAPAAAGKPRPAAQITSLDEYLRKRAGGDRR